MGRHRQMVNLVSQNPKQPEMPINIGKSNEITLGLVTGIGPWGADFAFST